MTRKKEIKCASKDYVNYLLDKQEYHNEDYTEDDIRQAFVKGAIFADNNPDLSSLWHDTSEKPRAKEWLLVQFGEDDYDIYHLNDLDIDMWYAWCETYDVIRWAYISDLLPKGGEE